MILKHVSLDLCIDEYPDSVMTPFGFRTRYLCNYIERQMRPIKFQSRGMRIICIEGQPNPDDSCPIVSVNAAVPGVYFDQQRYESLGPGEHHEFFIEMLTGGLHKCARHHDIPLKLLMDSIEEFRAGGYKNEWVHQSKLIRRKGSLRASLLCSLDDTRFELTLHLEEKGITLFKEPILVTKPDEIIFDHQFRDVKLDGDSVVVWSKLRKPIFSLDLSEVL